MRYEFQWDQKMTLQNELNQFRLKRITNQVSNVARAASTDAASSAVSVNGRL